MSAGYRGLPGAFVYAFRHSGSLLFRTYAVASALLAGFVVVLFALGLIRWILRPVGLVGERAFLLVIAILVFVPVVAPVLVVARRHRLRESRPADDRWVALAGYGVVVSVWLGLVIVAPPGDPRPGPLRPAVRTLYGLPDGVGIVPPLVGLVGLWIAVTRTRRPGG